MASPIGSSEDERSIQENIRRLTEAKDRHLRELERINDQLSLENVKLKRIANEKNPIFLIPNEIMSSIFMLVHDEYRCSNSARAHSKAFTFLIGISRLCVRWRNIVLHTPLLWSEIVMSFRNGVAAPGALDLLTAHLTRSADCFVDMALTLSRSHVAYPTFLDLIGRHSKRWRRVSFFVDYVADVTEFQNGLRDLETPNLEHFSISIQDSAGSSSGSPRTVYAMTSPPIFAHGCPKLTFLRVGGAAVGNLQPLSASLHTFHLDGWTRSFITWAQLRSLLEGLPQLQHLSLSKLCIRYPRDPFVEATVMHLPALTSLRIREPFTSMNFVLPLISTPKLRDLHLQQVDALDACPNPGVTSLSLEGCTLNELQLANAMDKFPNVEQLTVDECPWYPICTLLAETDSPLFPDVTTTTATTTTTDSPVTATASAAESSQAPLPTPLLWPNLKQVTVRKLTGADVYLLTYFVMFRKIRNAPLDVVRVDRRSRTSLRGKFRLDSLATEVSVEHCDSYERWPPGLGYDDPHDLED